MFELHPTLKNDAVEITRMDICRVLLNRDKTYPWLILVPERENLRDLDDLSPDDRTIVMAEIDRISKVIKAVYQPYKINVAALGNVVEQLHIHIIARFKNDPAWPAPVWGVVPAKQYSPEHKSRVIEKLLNQLEKS